jgi:hypothetical protein
MLVLYEGEIVCENVLRMLGFTFILCIERCCNRYRNCAECFFIRNTKALIQWEQACI